MAKAKLSADEELLGALRKGLGGAILLKEVKKTAKLEAADGMFVAGKASDALIEKAKDDGLIEVKVEEKAVAGSKKVTKVEKAELTPTGRHKVLSIDSPKQQLETLAVAVSKLTDQLAKLNAAVPTGDGLEGAFQTFTFAAQRKFEAFLGELQTDFAAQFKKESGPDMGSMQTLAATLLGEVKHAVAKATDAIGAEPEPRPKLPPVVPPVVVPPVVVPPVPPSQDDLATVLKDTYELLCLFEEFRRDKIVELPSMYHETKKKLPSLTVAEFHSELMKLWDERQLELKILNEVTLAKEPALGIEMNDALYYYVMWK